MFRQIWIPVALAIFGFASTSAYAQQLGLELTAPINGFLLGEPVRIHVKLTNLGSEAVTVDELLKPEYGSVVYEIEGIEGAATSMPFKFTPWAIKDAADPTIRLEPARSVEEDVNLFYNGKGWVFRESGAYRVKAVYQERVQSNTVTFPIVAPRNEAERVAADLMLSNPEVGRFLTLEGGDHLHRAIETLQRIVESDNTRNTPHAAHANLALGLSKLQPFADFTTSSRRESEPRLALSYLERVNTRLVGPTEAATNIVAQILANRLLGDLGKASELERNLPSVLRDQFPDLDLQRFQEQQLPLIKEKLLQ